MFGYCPSTSSRMLDKEPVRRPAAIEILQDSFLKQRMVVWQFISTIILNSAHSSKRVEGWGGGQAEFELIYHTIGQCTRIVQYSYSKFEFAIKGLVVPLIFF